MLCIRHSFLLNQIKDYRLDRFIYVVLLYLFPSLIHPMFFYPHTLQQSNTRGAPGSRRSSRRPIRSCIRATPSDIRDCTTTRPERTTSCRRRPPRRSISHQVSSDRRSILWRDSHCLRHLSHLHPHFPVPTVTSTHRIYLPCSILPVCRRRQGSSTYWCLRKNAR